MDLLNYFIPRLVYRSSSPYNTLIEVVSWRGQLMLYVNGIQQSGNYTTKLWKRALAELAGQKPHAGNILMLGVGGATAIHLLTDIYKRAAITVIDIDPEIIRIAREYFDLDRIPEIIAEVSDAGDWVVRSHKAKKYYDIIIVDLYIGNDVPSFASQRKFLKHVQQIMSPRGIVVMNYFSYHDHKKRADLLFNRLRNIYPSVNKKDIFYNTFFFCK